ncbi:MAG: FAD-dependent oxidoreductase [Lachnospiraceae bacterium]|jgi:thioredoxin reductase (NADPH)|nr:FAD-dependent oxidoreductase [Lachnospiraceae bacterium]MCI9590414.1 FAD-dependent oxidoreductase [Lachnospiraceae bacterium]
MDAMYDLIIIGAGPAGLAAGIYGGRAHLNTLILEKSTVGGRAYTTREIVNYPGIPSTSGPDLTEKMAEHAESFGVEIKREPVKSMDVSGDVKLVKTRRHEYGAKAVVIATGTSARILGIPGERELTGQGVAYCATCDAEFFQDQHVVVVGSGDQAIEEGMFITKFASRVTVIVLHEEGVLDCNKQAAEKALSHPKMDFVWNSVLAQVCGEDQVTGVKIKNMKTEEITDFACDGVFFFVGMIPETKWLPDELYKDSRGWLHVNQQMETNIPGVYAIGDVRDKYLRQVSTAISDGAVAATAAERYIEDMDYFRERVVESKTPVVLGFWSPEYPGSIDAIGKVLSPYPVMEIDVTRKKAWADRYQVVLSQETPAVALVVEKGELKENLAL